MTGRARRHKGHPVLARNHRIGRRLDARNELIEHFRIGCRAPIDRIARVQMEDCRAGIAILNEKLGKDDNFTKSLTEQCAPLLMDKVKDSG